MYLKSSVITKPFTRRHGSIGCTDIGRERQRRWRGRQPRRTGVAQDARRRATDGAPQRRGRPVLFFALRVALRRAQLRRRAFRSGSKHGPSWCCRKPCHACAPHALPHECVGRGNRQLARVLSQVQRRAHAVGRATSACLAARSSARAGALRERQSAPQRARSRTDCGARARVPEFCKPLKAQCVIRAERLRGAAA